ncbi:uncharacterized protein LOC130636220 [Hydractinia symbiolongicarpus]|uniref:uncharacterized protein LOC130636220 n=1 Tax=Hydractinia symbiolongicarpus TaxID=13093 RepID=UPI00254FAB95|nr:uncharacterized protein LOC130636220 [Hydractinia symbiolongicarpus]
MVGSSRNIEWEKDPLVFNFHNEIPGKTKMHTKSLKLEDWVRIDKSYPEQMCLKQKVIKEHKEQVFVSNDDEHAQECKWELFELLVEYLPRRFPDIFELKEGCIFNKVLDDCISTSRDDPEDPLLRTGRLTQEDWVIIEWSDDEQGYVLTSGIVYFPMRWSLLEKFNKGIASIHTPVKPFTQHLVHKVYDIFKVMKPEAPLWRANWAVFNDLDGPLDLYTPTGHDARNDVNQYTKYEGEKTGKELTFRAEYQTLRKLPKTKCIVFGIRTYQRYLNDFKNFPTRDSEGLIKAIENLNDDFQIYKGAKYWKEAAIKYLKSIINERKEKPSIDETKGITRSWYLPATLAVGVVATGLLIHRYRNN